VCSLCSQVHPLENRLVSCPHRLSGLLLTGHLQATDFLPQVQIIARLPGVPYQSLTFQSPSSQISEPIISSVRPHQVPPTPVEVEQHHTQHSPHYPPPPAPPTSPTSTQKPESVQ
jgi:hypothetical protein